MADVYNRIFIFSQAQMKQKQKIEGKGTTFGTVIVNGVKKTYTDIVRDMKSVPYSDVQKLIEGDIRKIKYTEPL